MKYFRLKFVVMFSIIVISLLILGCGSDNPVNQNSGMILFEKTFGGAVAVAGNDVIQTSDGGYMITGSKQTGSANGTREVYLLKVNNRGSFVWDKTFGGDGIEYGSTVLELPGGGFLIAGSTNSFGDGHDDFYLIKTDNSGNTIWARTYDAGSNDYCNSMVLTADGGCILVGSTLDDMYIVKVNSDGVLVWDNKYLTSYASSIVNTSDGNYMIAGTFYQSSGEKDLRFHKIDDNGNDIRIELHNLSALDRCFAISQTSDDNYVTTGITNISSTNGNDLFIRKINSRTNVYYWSKTFGGGASDVGLSIKQTTDEGYITLGYTNSIGAGDNDLYLVKVDSVGNLQWQKTFGDSSSDKGRSLRLTTDGGLIMVGSKGNELYLIKTDADGNIQ